MPSLLVELHSAHNFANNTLLGGTKIPSWTSRSSKQRLLTWWTASAAVSIGPNHRCHATTSPNDLLPRKAGSTSLPCDAPSNSGIGRGCSFTPPPRATSKLVPILPRKTGHACFNVSPDPFALRPSLVALFFPSIRLAW